MNSSEFAPALQPGSYLLTEHLSLDITHLKTSWDLQVDLT